MEDDAEKYLKLQEQFINNELKKKERLEWINQHWKIVGGKAYCEYSDWKYKTTIEVSIEIDSNGFKSLVVDVDKEETTPHGSWTTADIPLEIIEQLLK